MKSGNLSAVVQVSDAIQIEILTTPKPVHFHYIDSPLPSIAIRVTNMGSEDALSSLQSTTHQFRNPGLNNLTSQGLGITSLYNLERIMQVKVFYKP